VIIAALVAICAPNASAVTSVTARTSGGTACTLRQVASRSGGQITYGMDIRDCRQQSVVRYAQSDGFLYDRTQGWMKSTMQRLRGDIPYLHTKTTSLGLLGGGDEYLSKVEAAIVVHGGRHLEHWRDPGPACHVGTTYTAGDTLTCHFAHTY
jgi:hypothetical protein